MHPRRRFSIRKQNYRCALCKLKIVTKHNSRNTVNVCLHEIKFLGTHVVAIEDIFIDVLITTVGLILTEQGGFQHKSKI